MSLSLPGAGSDALRQRNLSAVLRLVSRHGPLSRADLARQTGLNRSTIGALVAELTEFGFVAETYPEMNRGMGRPSSIVSVNDRVVAAAVRPSTDLMTVALVGLGGSIHRRIELPVERVPTMPEAVRMSAAMIEGLRRDLHGAMRVVGVGAALPGLVRQRDGEVTESRALGWSAEPFPAALAEATSLPVLGAGEAQLAAIAEVVFGVGRDARDAVYLVSDGTDTSGGIVSGGALLRGSHGYAGDIGHTIVRAGGAPCSCGSAGCLTAEIGAARLIDAFGTPVLDLRAALESPVPPAAAAEVDRQLGLVAGAVVNLIRVLDPELVLLGEYLALLHATHPEVLQSTLEAEARSRPHLRMLSASWDADGPILGASQLAFTEMLNNPSVVALRLGQLAEDSKHWSTQRLNPSVFQRRPTSPPATETG